MIKNALEYKEYALFDPTVVINCLKIIANFKMLILNINRYPRSFIFKIDLNTNT